jgi:ribonucleoside-diphosphate reductase alpha chain
LSKYSENALKIYESLYFNPNENDYKQVHHRVAKCIANTDEEYVAFKGMLNDQILRPNSPCMINGSENINDPGLESHDKNLMACFVLNLEDSMESIMKMWTSAATIYAGAGGVGIPITNLREKGSPISVGGVASGPLEYLSVIDKISHTVKSGGKSRRAANLASFWYQHPDIINLINCKINKDRFKSINVSVLVTDEIMQSVKDKDFNKIIDLISPNKKTKTGTLTVGELWDNIVDAAWKCGDPGLLFYDKCNNTNPFPSYGRVEATNPCGEVALPPNNCCVLASLNLNKILIYDKEDEIYNINWSMFKTYIEIATLFLDNIIDKTSYPNKDFEFAMKRSRPIGLGLMGLADVFYKMHVGYGSIKSIELFESICKFMTKTAFEYSIDSVAENHVKSIEIPESDKDHFEQLLNQYGVDENHLQLFRKYGIRNSHVTSIAPTGSISISADCSYAFEPMFALVWKKKLVDNKGELTFINQELLNNLDIFNVKYDKEQLIKDITTNNGSIQNIDYIPDRIKSVFVTAHDVGWEKKIRMQQAGQKYISLAISSTCNLPNSSTKKDISNAFISAWESGLKGISIYRDGCLNEQPVNFGVDSSDLPVQNQNKPINRPIRRRSETIEISTPVGNLYITGSVDENDNLFEIFLNLGNIGHLDNLLLNTIARIISKGLQYHLPKEVFINTLMGMGGDHFWFKLDERQKTPFQAKSIIDAIAITLDMCFNNGKIINIDEKSSTITRLEKCPVCGEISLNKAIGCKSGLCEKCGFSACG